MKVRLDRLLMAGGVLILAIAGVVGWRLLGPDSPRAQAKLDQRLETLRDQPRGEDGARGSSAPRLPEHRRERSKLELGEGEAVPLPQLQSDPGELGPDEAVDAFKSALADLHAAVDEDRRLSQSQEWELYNRATGSFTALSAWADMSDPKQRKLIEDAYEEMTSLMGELELERPPQMRGMHDYDPRDPRRGWH